MGKLFEEFMDYISHASKEQINQDWEELKEYNNIGPSYEKWMEKTLEYLPDSPGDMNDIEKRVFKIICNILSPCAVPINRSSFLCSDLGMDNLDGYSLIVALEKEFSIYIEDDIFDDVYTVQDLMNAVTNIIGKDNE